MEVKRRLEVKPGISERLSLYKVPGARSLLRKLLAEGSVQLDISTQSQSGASHLLEMERLGIVVRSGAESVARDPATGRTLFMIKLVCPYCKSSSVVKEEMVEHRDCGFIGKLSEFQVRGGRLYCPRCGRPVRRAEIRHIGIWFRCKRCGQTFHKPEIAVYDPERAETIPIDRLEVSERAVYEINSDLKEEVEAVVSLYERIEASLRSLGLRAEPLGSVKGVSGIVHEFDLLVHINPVKVGVDVLVSSSQESLMQGILRLVTKYFDLLGSETRPLLFVAPRIPAVMRGMVSSGSLRDLVIVEGDTVSDLIAEAEVLGQTLTKLTSSTM